MPGKLRHDHAPLLRQLRGNEPPVRGHASKSVDKHDRRPGSADEVAEAAQAPGTAGYLRYALGGTGKGLCGRQLTDDVVDISLTAVFSDLLDPTQFVCKPFTLPLCTDNVASHGGFTATFPYLGPAK